MFKFLEENLEKLLTYSKFYLLASAIVFLLLDGTVGSFGKKIGVAVAILFAYFVTSMALGLMLNVEKKSAQRNMVKHKKTLSRHASFFMVFFSLATIIVLLAGVINLAMLPFALYAVNIPVAIVLKSVKAKGELSRDEKAA